MFSHASARPFRALLVLALSCAPLLAQEHPAIERGFAADKLYQFSDLDQVSYFSGSLSLSLPIGGEYPLSETMSYGLALSYGSKIWEFHNYDPPNGAKRSVPRPLDNAGMGWRVSLGRLLSPDHPSNDTQLWQYAAPDGSIRALHDRLHDGDPVVPGVFYTVDSSYLRMREISGGDRVVEFPSGEIHTFGADGKIKQIAGVYDNFVDLTYPDADTWKLTDQHGRVQTIHFKNAVSDGESTKIIDKIDVTAFGGATATYAFHYTNRAIHFPCSDPRDPQTTISVPQLDSLTLPDGSSYAFTYTSYGSCEEGTLESVTLPTRGTIRYTYHNWTLPTEGCTEEYGLPWARDSWGIWTRSLLDASGSTLGAWSYFQELSDPPSQATGQCSGSKGTDPEQVSTTTVTTPDGDKTVYYFSVWPNTIPITGTADGFRAEEYGLPINKLQADPLDASRFLSAEYFDCAAGGGNCVKMRSKYLSYEWEQPCLAADLKCQDSNRRVASERTVFHDDSDRYITVDRSGFDGLGNYRTTIVDGNFPGPGERTTFTNHNPGHDLVLIDNVIQDGYEMWDPGTSWVLGKFTDREVDEAGETSAKSQYCFADNGFLLRERILKGNNPGANDIIRLYNRDDFGNRIEERFHGGDVQNVGTGALCNVNLTGAQYHLRHTYEHGVRATTQYLDGSGASVGFYSNWTMIDPNTGLPSAGRDVSELQINYEFDALGRLAWIKPAVGHDAWIEYKYINATASAPASAEAIRRENGSETGTVRTREEFLFDDFGRVARERRLKSGNVWTERDTEYDAQGRRTGVSEWALEGAGRSWTEYRNYDAFDRPRTIRPPDGSAHDIFLEYLGTRQVKKKVKVGTARSGGVITESTAISWERYDIHGRLWRVVEPSGTGGGDVTTTYDYDVFNGLSSASTVSGATTQTRTFTRDRRGVADLRNAPGNRRHGDTIEL